MGIKLRKQIDKPASNMSEAEVLNEDTKLKRIKRVFGEDISDEQAEKYKDFLQAFKKAHSGESRADQEWILRQMKSHNGEIPKIAAGKNGMVKYTFSDGTSNELSTNLDNPTQYINDQSVRIGNGSNYIKGDVTGDVNQQANGAGDRSIVQGMNIDGARDGAASQKINSTGNDALKGNSSAGAKTQGNGTGKPGAPKSETPSETPGATPPAATQPGSNWWDFFGSKEFLIGLAAVTAIAGIIAAIKSLGNTIKARFRKTVKVLYNMQKDFGTSANGLDMDHALKGVGSKITDFFVKMFGSGEKGKGAIGLRPFVDNYRNEMNRDLESAMKSWNVVSQAGQQKPKADIPTQKSESNEVVYNSFFEAAQAGKLFESNGQPITESMTIGAVMAGLSLGRLALRGGQYVWSKFGSNGKKEKPTVVAVTKQSTREVCWSIMNAFFAKYFNCEGVAKKLGVDVQSLGDIDASNVDKFAKIVEQMKGEQADNKKVSIMFNRVKKGYDSMVERYLKIATNVVNNFEKYTKLKKGKNGEMMTEKESNLLVGGTEKLRAELDRQKDQYENNFYRVVNAIVSSDEYISYIDFIISQVIPVFKSGLASDADFVLDVMPKKGELYVIRQTNQDQGNEGGQLDAAEGARGLSNVGLVEVIGVDAEGNNSKNPIIKFKRRALLIGDDITHLSLNDEGKYDLSGLSSDNYDTKAFAKDVRNDNGENNSNLTDVELPYNKWAALDPHVAINSEIEADTRDDVQHANSVIGMRRQGDQGEEEMLFIIPEEPKQEAVATAQPSDSEKVEYKPDAVINEEGEQNQEGENQEVARIEYIKKDPNGEDKAITIHTEGKGISVESFLDFANQPGSGETKMGFTKIDDDNKAKEAREASEDLLKNAEQAGANKQEDVPAIINRPENTIAESLRSHQREYANEIAKILSNVKLDNKWFNINNTGNSWRIRLVEGQNNVITITSAQDQNIKMNVIPVKTGVQTNSGKDIYIGVCVYSDINDNTKNKNYVLPDAEISNPQQETQDANTGAITKILSRQDINDLSVTFQLFVDNSGNYVFNTYSMYKGKNGFSHFALANYQKEIVTFLSTLFTTYEQSLHAGKGTIEENEEQPLETQVQEGVEYSTNMKLEEMTNLNTIKVTRNIKSSIDTKGLYILSESCWGDGSIAQPAKYLNESYESIKNSCNNYSELASYVKAHKHCSLVPFNESYEVKVQAPYNRYAMLTEGCALYEHLSYIQFNNTEDKEISHIYNVGVYKFIK